MSKVRYKKAISKITVLLMFMMLLSPLSKTFAQVDSTAPVLNSISLSSTSANPNNPVTVAADVTDDLSGVSNVYVTYYSPSKNNYKNVWLYYNSTDKKYEGKFYVGQYDETGDWTIDYIDLQDNAGN